MTVRATYRLQFTADFRFSDGAALAPYLADLGISHVYASPIFAAREGSTHGYDGVDYNRLNPALGSEDAFRAMVRAFQDHGLKLILDFVPNHMGVGGADNAFWMDVLEWGPDSLWAHWFDIGWETDVPGLQGKVLFPFLGDHYGAVLASGGLRLRLEDGKFAVWAHDTHKLPVCPRTYGMILTHAEGVDVRIPSEDTPAGDAAWEALHSDLAGAASSLEPALRAFEGREGDLASWDRLDALIARQNWRAARFNLDGDAINYRRFFTMSDLAGVRVEREDVFDETHALMLQLLNDGVVDGIRIDHIDGLLDPKGYTLRLREKVTRRIPLYVEKILAPDEALPADWDADGTTGYEFANQVIGMLVDPAAEAALGRFYAQFTGKDEAPEEIVHAGKLHIMALPMAAEVEALTTRLLRLAARDPRLRDFGRSPMRMALVQVLAALDVYRTYGDASGMPGEGRARLEAAVERARPHAPALDPALFDFIHEVLSLDLSRRMPEVAEEVLATAMRFQQVSGPVMAKGLEDTALYRFNRLIALNEVGSEPGHFGVSIDDFHAANEARVRDAPRAMLSTSTHDTKRGEDARVRIGALTSHVDAWMEAVPRWHEMLHDPDAPVDRNEEYFFYQLLLGVWPDEGAGEDLEQRVTEAVLKSAREAGANTRWVFGNEGYEAALRAFVGRAMEPGGRFLADFAGFAGRVAPDGRAGSLIQTTLKLTVPGVPDIYQGSEMWDQSLVDPDNRRPVDFAHRAAKLRQLAADVPIAAEGGEEAKLALTARLLALRRERPELFASGAYTPVAGNGPAADRLCAFLREGEGGRLLVAVALPGRNRSDWADTDVEGVPKGRWRNLMDGTRTDTLHLRDLFDTLPVAVMLQE